MTWLGGRRAVAAGLLAIVVAVGALGGCSAPTARSTFPPLGVTPPPAGDATASTTALVITTLGARGLQVVRSTRAYRPPEGPLLAAAPRTVLQVLLPNDPDGAFIVLYALASVDAAQAGAADLASYIASGPGRIQFRPDTHFVIRLAGPAVLFFTWSPSSALDQRMGEIEVALSTIGTGVTVPA